MNKNVFAFLFGFLIFAGITDNRAYAAGEESYQKGLEIFNGINPDADKYKNAFSYFVQAAKEGNADAYFMLALYSDMGIAVRKNPGLAFMRYQKSADLGNAYAMFSVADMYMNGEGVEHNMDEAVNWFTKSAEHGNAEAAYNLGAIYLTGIGVKPNPNKAKQWFNESYKLGNPTALLAGKMNMPITLYHRLDRALKK